MSGFTKGPWKIQGENLDREIEIRSGEGDTLCIVLPADESDESVSRSAWSDARLIAAAPELYEALRGLLAYPIKPAGDGVSMIDKARAALSRASEGEQT